MGIQQYLSLLVSLAKKQGLLLFRRDGGDKKSVCQRFFFRDLHVLTADLGCKMITCTGAFIMELFTNSSIAAKCPCSLIKICIDLQLQKEFFFGKIDNYLEKKIGK